MMYVYPYNIHKIHYHDNIMYVITNKNSIKKLNFEQTVLMSYVVNKSNEYNTLVENIKECLNINEKNEALYKTSQIINSLKDCIKISFSKQNLGTTPIVTGAFNKCYPYAVQIALTNRCLHNCQHCYMNASQKGNDLDLEQLEELLKYLENYTSTIEFTGGEPFLYKDLEKVLEKYKKNFEFAVTTSGFWERRFSDETLKNFNTIQLTLYGHSSEEHDKFVRTKGSFNAVIQNIHRIMDNDINLIVQTQARSDDIQNLRKFTNMCIREGIPNIMIGEIIPIGRAKNLNIFSQYNKELIQKNIRILKNEYGESINIIFDNKRYNNMNQNSNFFKCGAGKIKWHITENGVITPCALFDKNIFSMGNIYNRDYIKLVESKDVFNSIENKWFKSCSEIIETYKNNGESFDDICHSISRNF